MGVEIPVTTVECSGCGGDLNVLMPYLSVQVKAQREILVSQDVPQSGDDAEVPEPLLYLGTKSGRGVILKFHEFDCMKEWVEKREGKKAKIEVHSEEGDPYVPEDNRTPEELVEAGELPGEFLEFHEAVSEFVPAGAPFSAGNSDDEEDE